MHALQVGLLLVDSTGMHLSLPVVSMLLMNDNFYLIIRLCIPLGKLCLQSPPLVNTHS